MTNKITKCPNCGRDSFLQPFTEKAGEKRQASTGSIDLMCADCTRAFGKGQAYGYKSGKKEERKSIIEKIKKLNKPEGLTMSTLNNEEVHILYDHDLAELEKGDA